MKLKFQRSRIEIFFCLFLLCSSFALMAQTTMKGKVLSGSDNMPLPGASVIEKGTTNGTQTDFDGAFALNVSSESSVIVVSYVGFKTKEVAYKAGDIIVILEDDNALSEVVVVGYGTQKKSDIVNAGATTDLDKATLSPSSDVNEMLRGRIAGLQVDVGGGTLRPGGTSEILFRGRGSIEGNTSAIYVVDGIVREGGIEDIDADDIQSVEFLKDASAQAIYGTRGANGVVLVTTKRGKAGSLSVSYHGFLTTKKIERNFDVYSGQEFAQLRREAVRSTRFDDSYADDVIDNVFTAIELDNINNNRFVDWEDELMRNGVVNSQSISISGGTDMTKVFGSLNYFKEDGIIPTSNYTRKTFRLNVDQKISDKFSVNFDLNFLNDDTDRAANVNVITTSPLGSAYNDDGSITRFPSGEELSAVNPLWNLREQNNEEKGNDFVVNITPIWQITNDLQYQLKANFSRKTSERGQYLSSLSSAGDDVRGIARIENQLTEGYLVENILTYDKTLGDKHKVNATLVQSIQEHRYSRTFTEGQGFGSDDLGYEGIDYAIGNITVDRSESPFNLASFMARVRYGFMDKYLFTGTVRGDASSTLGEGKNGDDKKWIWNPAGSFAWKIHNESFLEDVNSIQELKFRASYGSLANAPSGPFRSLFLAQGEPYIFDGETASGNSPSTILPNPDLKFERITTLNFGLDFSILNRTFVGNINWYDARTNDLLLKRGVPSTTGYSFSYFNAGEMQNTGLELGLTANIINTDDLKWSVSTNWSNNKNEILELYNDGEGNAVTEDNTYNYYVGQPVGVIYQYEFDGIWQEGEDFAGSAQADPESALPQPDLRAGDIKIKDVNSVDDDGNVTKGPDGKITQEDRVFIDPNPDWFGSLSTTIEYKGFDLLLDFYIVEGATKVNPFLNSYNNGGTLQGKLNGVKVDYYTPENPSNSFPRPNFEAPDQYLNSLAVKDASYVRLRTVSLGYTLSDNIVSKFNFDQIRFYVTATNVFTDTDYIGYSPEVNIRDTFSSADTGYPDAKSFTFGVRVKF